MFGNRLKYSGYYSFSLVVGGKTQEQYSQNVEMQHSVTQENKEAERD